MELEDWNGLQYNCSVGDIDEVKDLIYNHNVDTNSIHIQSRVVPQVSSLHIACKVNSVELVYLLLKNSADPNQQDQWGFTPLHYATVKRNKEVVGILQSNGATASIKSKNGCTAYDLAVELGYDDIADLLSSRLMSEKDPSLLKFRAWLTHLGGSEYLSNFLNAGYDLPFIAKLGSLSDADLDAVGIPSPQRLGLRKKLAILHDLTKYYQMEEVGQSNESDEEDDGEEEEESEEEETDDDDA